MSGSRADRKTRDGVIERAYCVIAEIDRINTPPS